MDKEVAYKPNTTACEDLPYPIVLYPGFYGSFFAFKQNKKAKPHFCSCAYEAIENYIRIRQSSEIPLNSYPDRMYLLDSHDFPKSVVQTLMQSNIPDDQVLANLNFADKLCHECNLQTPSYRYCVEMYGGAFKQNYGWYIGKQAYEWGFDRSKSKLLIDSLCPEDLLELVNDESFQYGRKRRREIADKTFEFDRDFANISDVDRQEYSALFQEARNIDKSLSKHYRKINNVVENEVRRKFGHKNVGEAWTSETILYYIVKKLYPEHTIHRHYRPDFLDGLELDIYIEELNIGIEYQGIQHYKPVKHWGGEDALKKLQQRDKKKRNICKKIGIPLIYFEHDEGLSDSLVVAKLSDYES
ncbi:hypothetical protein H6786_00440 [Candidatus Nomurabacteria bacterium]|nr:hypothetical protein [Candidatus Nomurabacteria bacterium]